MNLNEYRDVFTACSLVLILAAAAPTLSLILPFPSGNEAFSELWVLGPNHMAEDYPFNVCIGKEYNVFVGVSNHMGCSEYYLVYAKFRNQTQPLPDSSKSKPSPLNSTYEFRLFLANGETWESLLTFEISNASVNGDRMLVGDVKINGVPFPVNSSSTWDSQNKGFYYQLFLELWLYNMTTQRFQYHNRFVGIWLNATLP